MYSKCIYYFLSIGLCSSCTDTNKPSHARSQPVTPVVNNKPQMMEAEKIDTAALKTLSPEQASVKFGKPLKSEDFNLSAPLSEFRIEIYNYLPKEDRHSSKVNIREYTWPYNSKYNITAWYRQKQNKWHFLHYNIWPKDAEF